MAESVVRAFYARARSLKMSSKNLKEVPLNISMLPQLSVLLLNNNHICTLPVELLLLPHVRATSSLWRISKIIYFLTELNLGNNTFKEFPAVIGHLEHLRKLYLYSNHISAVPSQVIGSLKNLCVLNLNHNFLQRLPTDIKSLTKLQCLSLAHNKLEVLPAEFGHLTELTEVNLTDNCLTSLPQEIYQCQLLTKIHLARNQLNCLPEGIQALTKLQILDVAGNKLSMFPAEFHQLHLKELYCEGNAFVQCHPAPSVLGLELLSLKELVARFVLHQDRNKASLIHKMLPYFPNLVSLLAKSSYCSRCLQPILTTWLECVHFVNIRKVMKIKRSLTVPVRALLCSYKCFNTGVHEYYGVVSA